MKRVLVVGFTQNYGGMESYIMEIYRNIDRERMQFDFLTMHKGKIAFEDEIRQMGGKIYFLPIKRNDFFGHYKILKEVFKSNYYNALYYQSNRKLQSLDIFKFAKKYKVKTRALHAHNSTQESVSKITDLRQKYAEKKMDKYINCRLACSKEAGKWMFGNRSFEVIKNSVDDKQFYFDLDLRNRMRKELGVENQLVIGTVGRLTEVKNPFFMINMFEQLLKRNKECIFLHIGDGEDKNAMCEKIKKAKLDSKYKMLGVKKNVNDYLNAMDILVLPSIHEGFPMVLVEAQLTGLKCIVADNIPQECNLTGNLKYLPINQGTDIWCSEILNTDLQNRSGKEKEIKEQGYNIKKIAKRIETILG